MLGGSRSGSRDEYGHINADKQVRLKESDKESRMNPELNNKTVCIAGLGYVGLPLALACLQIPGDDRLRRGRRQDPGALRGER